MAIANIYYKMGEYEMAIDICKEILGWRPTDYPVLADLALLYQLNGDDSKALEYLNQSVNYFPFSFERNEKIRELDGKTPIMTMIDEVDPISEIEEFKSGFNPMWSKPYDIVFENKSRIIYNNRATAFSYKYILHFNDESGLKDWQNISIKSSSTMESKLIKAQVIKSNGDIIEGQINEENVLFTNLEIGDYIFVHYEKRQFNGGKSSLFFDEFFNFNATYPVFKRSFDLFVEEGFKFTVEQMNGEVEPIVSTTDGISRYTWDVKNPDQVKTEYYRLPFNDISFNIQISVENSWNEILNWYFDLSEFQSRPDFTIERIASELFPENRAYSEEEKAKIIYNFICTNIQYSSLDFRQSGYVPQRAAKVYHSRLGDCKDVSTLFVSLAKASGLQANLVLMNTSDNGYNHVQVPSLNFNHCIAKVIVDSKPIYLELTDSYLPFGYSYSYHYQAQILDISVDSTNSKLSITNFNGNEHYESNTLRESKIKIFQDGRLNMTGKQVSTGANAASKCSKYFNLNDEGKVEEMTKMFSKKFNSEVTLNNLNFSNMTPLEDTVTYVFDITVDDEIDKIGKLNILEIPFLDVLITKNIIDEKGRINDFDFIDYETTDIYLDKIFIELPENMKFEQLPNNIESKFMENTYALNINMIDDQHLVITREYRIKRENISTDNFNEFKSFTKTLLDGENAKLVFIEY